MTITDIKIRKVFDNDGPMKAIASVTFDGALAVHDVKVIYARERYFIVMPCKRIPTVPIAISYILSTQSSDMCSRRRSSPATTAICPR